MNFPKYMKPAVWRRGNILNVALFIHTKLHFLVLIVTYEHSRRRMHRQTDRHTLRKYKGFRIFSSGYENLKNRDTHRLDNPLNGFLSVNLRVIIIANTQTVIVHLGHKSRK